MSVDLDTTHLTDLPGVEVHRHDINDGLPVDGPFDLIHARLVLMHIARRAEVVTMLVDALAPGGWLVIGDFSARERHVLSAPADADAELFDRIQDVGHAMGVRTGVSMTWPTTRSAISPTRA